MSSKLFQFFFGSSESSPASSSKNSTTVAVSLQSSSGSRSNQHDPTTSSSLLSSGPPSPKKLTSLLSSGPPSPKKLTSSGPHTPKKSSGRFISPIRINLDSPSSSRRSLESSHGNGASSPTPKSPKSPTMRKGDDFQITNMLENSGVKAENIIAQKLKNNKPAPPQKSEVQPKPQQQPQPQPQQPQEEVRQYDKETAFAIDLHRHAPPAEIAITNSMIMSVTKSVASEFQAKVKRVLESKRGRAVFSDFIVSFLNKDFSQFQGSYYALHLEEDVMEEDACAVIAQYLNKDGNSLSDRLLEAKQIVHAHNNHSLVESNGHGTKKRVNKSHENLFLELIARVEEIADDIHTIAIMKAMVSFISSSEEYQKWLREEEEKSNNNSNNSSLHSTASTVIDTEYMEKLRAFRQAQKRNAERQQLQQQQQQQQQPSLSQSQSSSLNNSRHLNIQGAPLFVPLSPTEEAASTARLSAIAYATLEEEQELTFGHRCRSSFNTGHLYKVLRGQKWLTELISAFEALPFSISIASAHMDSMKGFPLIYINQAFVDATGFSKEEVLGNNSRFLQCKETSLESIQTIRDCLQQGTPLKISIMNATKGGKLFRNLIALKPIFDQHGVYRFVVSLQFKLVEGESINLSQLCLLEKIYDMIPEVMFSFDDEETLIGSLIL